MRGSDPRQVRIYEGMEDYGGPIHVHPMTENELKHAVLKMARRQGWAVYHVPQTTMHNGGGIGYPDLTLARDKEVLWMELKIGRAHV